MSTVYGHCYRCGVHYFRKEDLAGMTMLLPTCECAGDPPVDQAGEEWLVWLGRVHYLHYEPRHDGVPVAGAVTISDSYLLFSLLDEDRLANGLPPTVAAYDADGKPLLAWLNVSATRENPVLVVALLVETETGGSFYTRSVSLDALKWPVRVLEHVPATVAPFPDHPLNPHVNAPLEAP